MNASFCATIMLITIAFPLFGADKLNFDFFQNLPSELQRKILFFAHDASNSCGLIPCNQSESLVLPTTTLEEACSFTIEAKNGTSDVASGCRVTEVQGKIDDQSPQQKLFQITVPHLLGSKDYHVPVPNSFQLNSKNTFFFEGYNTCGLGLFAMHEYNRNNCRYMFLKKKETGSILFTSPTCVALHSCTLQHDKNRIFVSYSSKKCVVDENLTFIKNGEKKYKWEYKSQPALTVYELSDDKKMLNEIHSLLVKAPIKKTVCFGNNVFAYVQQDNRVQFFSFDKNQKMSFLPTIGLACFANIAVNPSFENKNGFRYRFAVQGPTKEDETADIFVCDLSECYRPTLLYVCTIKNAQHTENIYYHGNEITVLYGAHEDGTREVSVYKDSFAALWFGYIIRHYGKEKRS